MSAAEQTSGAPAELIKAGARVAWRAAGTELQGTVETYRLIGVKQVLTVRTDAGQRIALLAEKVGAASMVTAASEAADARSLATVILAGGANRLRLPINRILNILALAVMTGAETPSESP